MVKVRVRIQEEPLMQEKRDNEIKAGTSEWEDPILTYQILAEHGNEDAKKILNLVHTIASMLRANDAINSLPSTTGDDLDYPSGASAGSIGYDSLGKDAEDVGRDFGGEVETRDWMFIKVKSLLKAHLESLQLHKIQALQDHQTLDVLKHDIAQVKQDIYKRLDAKLPESTMTSLNQNLWIEYDLNKKVEDLGEKDVYIQVSKVTVPAITFSKPPVLDSINLLNIAEVELRLKDQMKKIDEKIEKLSESYVNRINQYLTVDQYLYWKSGLKDISTYIIRR
ncbi:hypothetical protein AgCh_031157 [Apium graveolens]